LISGLTNLSNFFVHYFFAIVGLKIFDKIKPSEENKPRHNRSSITTCLLQKPTGNGIADPVEKKVKEEKKEKREEKRKKKEKEKKEEKKERKKGRKKTFSANTKIRRFFQRLKTALVVAVLVSLLSVASPFSIFGFGKSATDTPVQSVNRSNRPPPPAPAKKSGQHKQGYPGLLGIT
jgi:hypothetical protein